MEQVLGSTPHAFRTFDDMVNITGGIIGDSFEANGGEVNISGGTLGDYFEARNDAVVRMSGGTIGRLGRISTDFFELVGGDFRRNGDPIADEDAWQINLRNGDVLTGVLSDGSPFIFTSDDRLSFIRLSSVDIDAPDLQPLVVDGQSQAIPTGLRPGQSITLREAGKLDRNFAVIDSELKVEGGEVGRRAELLRGVLDLQNGTVGDGVVAYAGSIVNVSGGTISASQSEFGVSLDVRKDSSLAMTGGYVDRLFADGNVEIHGGEVGDDSRTTGAVVITDGIIGDSFSATGQVMMSGGSIGSRFRSSSLQMSGGNVGALFSAQDVEFVGNEFRLNGTAYRDETFTLGSSDILTGTLADGSTFIFSGWLDTIPAATLTRVTLPNIDLAEVVVDTDSAGGVSGLRAGQTLNLKEGGRLGENFAVVDATLDIEGGAVGRELEAAGSTVNVMGGLVGSFVHVNVGTVLNVSGGELAGTVFANTGSEVNVTGGIVGDLYAGRTGSVTNIAGGTLGDNFNANAGSEFHLLGNEFLLDGVALDELQPNVRVLIEQRGGELSGTLSDGTAFSFDLNAEDGFNQDYFDPQATVTIMRLVECSGDHQLTLEDLSCATVVDSQHIVTGLDLQAGDFDGNGSVDFGDFLRVSKNFGKDVDKYVAGDIDGDGAVLFSDFLLLSANFGAKNSPMQPVPEPDVEYLMWFALGIVCLARPRNKRGGWCRGIERF